ncbi:MAG: tetratricopeptide repeat protein [Candidatus Micrarchaeota archaeon]
MPVQQERKPSLQDELRKEQIGPEVELKLAKAPQVPQVRANPRTSQQNIMVLDSSKHTEEIAKYLKPGICAFSEGREFESLSNLEKLDALVYAMRDKDYFKINYVRHQSPTVPQTVEETFTLKQGDCDELSRVYVALAKELGITNLTQCYVNFKNTETGEHEGHAALFFVDGQVLYADPGFEKAYSFDKRYGSIEEAKKDQEFLAQLAKWQGGYMGGTWIVDEIAAMKNPSALEGTYNFEMASYAITQGNWNTAKEQAQEALTKGMECSASYFLLGQSYYHLKDYSNAIFYLKKAVQMIGTDQRYYAALGDSYSRDGKHIAATEAFREQTKLQPNNFEAILDLVTELKDAGKSAIGKQRFADAVKYYGEAEKVLSDFLKNKTVTEVDKAIAKALLPEVRQNLQDARRKISN